MKNRVLVSTIGDILNIRYLESIREKEGGCTVWVCMAA